ncbi:Protoporphyrin uptake protein 1 like [Fusarium sp. Ph1]|nr:Protoporphyrin uptake protein 1 like [Fusarium sp. Ph1]
MSHVLFNKTEPPFGPIVNGTKIVFFEYRPNEGAAWTFVVLFGLSAVVHLGLLGLLRAWHFLPLTLGVIGEAFGYYGCVQAHSKPNIAGPFIMQNILILGTAPLIAATVYMTLGRYIRVFQIRDRIVFGSATPASGDPKGISLGRTLIISGLIVQLAALGLFLIITLVSHRLVRTSRVDYKMTGMLNASRYFQATYLVGGAMMVRSLVRGIEYLQGEGGYIISHEVFIYALDAAPMVFVAAVYIFIHPGKLLRDAQHLKGESERLEMSDYERLTH